MTDAHVMEMSRANELAARLDLVRGQRDLLIGALAGLLEPATDEELAKWSDESTATLVLTVGELRRARSALTAAGA